jgi:hypothetical protein
VAFILNWTLVEACMCNDRPALRRSGRCPTSHVLALGIGLSANACSLAVDAGREQCVTDTDCARLGADFSDGVCVSALCRVRPDPNWTCLDEARVEVTPIVPERVRILVPFVDVVTGQQVPNVEVRACERLDTECQTPSATGVSNEAGEADLRLPGGFNGYLRWQATDIYPTMFFIGSPLIADAILPVNVISPAVFEGLNAQFRSIALEDRTAVVVNVKNCSGAPAAGVNLSVPDGDAATRVFYIVDGLFPPSQTETTVAGLARVINVPPGNISISGSLADGREMGRVTVLTQPGVATVTNLRPTSIRGD